MTNIFKNLTKLLATAVLFCAVASPATAAPSSKIKLQDLAFVPVVSTDTLQSGTTFYVSSGAVTQELNILGQLKFSDGTLLTSTNTIAGYLLSSTNTWTAPNTFLQIVTASITGNAATVTNGAYINIDNNWAQTQTFQYGILVETITANGDISADTLIGSTVTALGQFNFDAMYGTSAVLTGSFAANTATVSTFTVLGQSNFDAIYGSSATFLYTVTASSFNAVGTAYMVNGSTVIDGTGRFYPLAGIYFPDGSTIASTTTYTTDLLASSSTWSAEQFFSSAAFSNVCINGDCKTAWSAAGGNLYTDLGVVGDILYYVATDSAAATGIKPSQLLTSTSTRVAFNDVTNNFSIDQRVSGKLLVSSASVVTDSPTTGFDTATISVLHFNNNITDEVGLSWTGSPSYDASGKWGQAIYSGISLAGASAGDYDCSSSGNECTIDFWFKTSPSDTASNKIFNFNTGGYFSIRYNGTSGGFSSLEMARDSLWNEYTGYVIPDGVWTHIAVVQYLDTLKLYVNGTLAATKVALLSGPGTSVALMNNSVSSMDEFRFSRSARWTTDFTVPTSPYATSDTTTSRAMWDVIGTAKAYVLAVSSDSTSLMVTVSSTTGKVDITGEVSSSTSTVRGKTDFGAKTHAELQLLACPTLPCVAMSSDAPYHIYIATEAATAGSWQDEAGAAP